MAATTTEAIRPMYSCEGARVIRDQDGIAFIEVSSEPTDEDWDKLLLWVKLNGFSFGGFGPIFDYAEDFNDGYGDRYILVDMNEDREEVEEA